MLGVCECTGERGYECLVSVVARTVLVQVWCGVYVVTTCVCGHRDTPCWRGNVSLSIIVLGYCMLTLTCVRVYAWCADVCVWVCVRGSEWFYVEGLLMVLTYPKVAVTYSCVYL